MTSIPPTASPNDHATACRTTPALIDVGHALGSRYEVRRLLGRGAMGEVWLAFDLKLRVEVALKDLTFRQDDRETLRREVRSARDVISPNVCRVFDLVEADGRELLSMEYVDGTTLRKVIEDRSPLDLNEAQSIASQLLAGLEAIHGAGLVHRDVKPENLMITKTGRVVIMDFGLAREARSEGRSIAGTPAYMSPEQAVGDFTDPRTDFFAVGVLLTELVSGARTREARNSIWEGIRRHPSEIPDGPWAALLRKAVARDRGERFQSAREMARALEEVTFRVTAAEEKRPYPGLAAFTESEAEFFFGREAELEAMLRKLERFHLLALIGSSGAGKSSFLRAGVIPMLPKSWGVILCHPGGSPFVTLGQALAPQLSDLPDLAREMVRFHETDAAISLLRRWRSQHEQALIIIDQFEELFTLNPRERQAQFAELLRGAVLDADVRVLLALRDDFLGYCHEYDALGPIFSELTPLSAPAGGALRRALVQPALRCGYRFEDDELVESMLSEVGEERGTLPLLAFAASRLWEKRDREAGVLTCRAYTEIGGVRGALAQHAEETLGRVGAARAPIVREIFRNLATAQGTRVSRARNELLSVFGDDRTAAEEVLTVLTEARLLTTFEGRIEIVHESLLTAWPRLVQWRAQDAEGAILRDQLRQAASLWHERGRPNDLFWSGNSYREFLVWRSRYPGGLSEIEEQFATAMIAHAGRRRRGLQIAAAAVVAIAIIIAGITTAFWRHSVAAERQARAESQRAEAAKLLALAQVELERFPTVALAYATKSLETHDTPEARRFAIRSLWRGPTAFILPLPTDNLGAADFNADGKWFALARNRNDSFLVADDGRQLKLDTADPIQTNVNAAFDPSGRFLIVGTNAYPEGRHEIRVFSVPDGVRRRSIRFEGDTSFLIGLKRLFTATATSIKNPKTWTVKSWNYDGTDGSTLANFPEEHETLWSLHPSGEWIVIQRDKKLWRKWLKNGREELLWDATAAVKAMGDSDPLGPAFSPAGDFVAMALESGVIVKSFTDSSERDLRLRGRRRAWPPHVAQSRIAWMDGTTNSENVIWNLADSAEAEPLTLQHTLGDGFLGAALQPNGNWAATLHSRGVAFWATGQPQVRTFSGPAMKAVLLAFTSDSKWLAVCAPIGGLTLIPLKAAAGSRHQSPPAPHCQALTLASDGQRAIAGGFLSGLYVVSVASAESTKRLEEVQDAVVHAAIDHAGRYAVATVAPRQPDGWLGVWDLQSGALVRRFPRPPAISRWSGGGGGRGTIRFSTPGFTFDDTLLLRGPGGIHRWNIETGEHHLFFASSDEPTFALSADGAHLLLTDGRKPGAERLTLIDLRTHTQRVITSHGSDFVAVALDASGQIIATADNAGVIRVGKATGEEPHLLIGHAGPITALMISTDRRTIASSAEDGTVRLWPMPDLSKPPLHMLAHSDLIAKLKSLTNVRVVADQTSENGYRVAYDRFPGWKQMPRWEP